MKLPFVIKVNLISLWKAIRWFRKNILKKKVQKRNFGYIQDHFDNRDVYYRLKIKPRNLPESTYKKNINQITFRYNQGPIGSCVGHGAVAAYRRSLQTNKLPDFYPSRLFAYYIARSDSNKQVDSGAMIRDAFKAINNYGICHESLWPYITAKYAEEPLPAAWTDALNHQSISYERIYPHDKTFIMDALNQGYAIVFGIVLHESFMSDRVAETGIIKTPKCWEEEIGGHCMLATDYDKDGIWVLNSWGEEWGQNGVCHITWEYFLSKHTSDLWVFHNVEG